MPPRLSEHAFFGGGGGHPQNDGPTVTQVEGQRAIMFFFLRVYCSLAHGAVGHG